MHDYDQKREKTFDSCYHFKGFSQFRAFIYLSSSVGCRSQVAGGLIEFVNLPFHSGTDFSFF